MAYLTYPEMVRLREGLEHAQQQKMRHDTGYSGSRTTANRKQVAAIRDNRAFTRCVQDVMYPVELGSRVTKSDYMSKYRAAVKKCSGRR